MVEIWKAVVGYEGKYEVSNMGNVRSLAFLVYSGLGKYRTVVPKLLKTKPCKYGYPKVNLSNVTHKVHTLVATAFLDKPCMDGYHGATVNHKNGIKTDNRVENLEWVSMKDNLLHARLTGLNLQQGENNSGCKFSLIDACFAKITTTVGGFYLKDIAFEIKATISWVSAVKRGRLWKNIQVVSDNNTLVLRVERVDGKLVQYDQQTREQEQQGLLEVVFEDGVLVKETSLTEIRKLIREQLA